MQRAASPSVILIGTGTEVALCVDAYEALMREGIAARVVSMPSWELFEQQDQTYRDSILPPEVTARVSVEQASEFQPSHHPCTGIPVVKFRESPLCPAFDRVIADR